MMGRIENSFYSQVLDTPWYTLCELALRHHGQMAKPHPLLYGLSPNDLVRLCGVDISTARRWKRGAFCPPKTALMILARDLGCFSDYWRGWTINGEDIVSPEGWCIDRNHALALPLVHGQVAALRQKVAQLEKELARAGALPDEDWVIELSVGPPGQLRTLRASLREFNNDVVLLPKKKAAE